MTPTPFCFWFRDFYKSRKSSANSYLCPLEKKSDFYHEKKFIMYVTLSYFVCCYCYYITQSKSERNPDEYKAIFTYRRASKCIKSEPALSGKYFLNILCTLDDSSYLTFFSSPLQYRSRGSSFRNLSSSGLLRNFFLPLMSFTWHRICLCMI